jgi:hypothetical protein
MGMRKALRRRLTRGRMCYLALAVLILVGYGLAARALWAGRGWDSTGPLSFTAAPSTFEPPLLFDEDDAHVACAFQVPRERQVVRAAVIDGQPMYACYSLDGSGKVTDAWVIRETGDLVEDRAVLKRAGAWQWVEHAESTSAIVSRGELFNVGVIIFLVSVFWLSYYWLPRPGRPADASRWWQRSGVLFGFAFVPLVGLVFLRYLPGISRGRAYRALWQAAAAWGLFVFLLTTLDGPQDELTVLVEVTLASAYVFGVIGGRLLVAPQSFGLPETDPQYNWSLTLRGSREDRTGDVDAEPQQPAPAVD